MRKKLILLLAILWARDEVCASQLLKVPAKVRTGILTDYGSKAESTAGITSIWIQDEQTFIFGSHTQRFAVLPFTYIPTEPGSTRQCIIRILTVPQFTFVQDLRIGNKEVVHPACNGVIAIGFRDVNHDHGEDVIVLYDLTTRGNADLSPYPSVYALDRNFKFFNWDETLSEKAAKKNPKTIRSIFLNLK